MKEELKRLIQEIDKMISSEKEGSHRYSLLKLRDDLRLLLLQYESEQQDYLSRMGASA